MKFSFQVVFLFLLCIYAKTILTDFNPQPLKIKYFNGYELFILLYMIGLFVEEVVQVSQNTFSTNLKQLICQQNNNLQTLRD